MKNVLVLCTGNSARSIMAEAYFNHAGGGQWKAYSAGSTPTGQVNPFALKTLEGEGITMEAPRSKSWDEFSLEGAPEMDLVVTVCDNAANETCPYWPGAPRRAHWPFPDPAAVEGSDAEKLEAFQTIFADIKVRIDAFLIEEQA